MSEYPTEWQQKTIWGALSTLSVVAIGAVSVGLIWLTSQVLGFMQPILIPFAVAGVMAYLLDPVVSRLVSWGQRAARWCRENKRLHPAIGRFVAWSTDRHRAVLCVFAAVTIFFAGILVWLVPAASAESSQFAHKLPKLIEQARQVATQFTKEMQEKYNFPIFRTPPDLKTATPAPNLPSEDMAPEMKPAEPAPAPDSVISSVTPSAKVPVTTQVIVNPPRPSFWDFFLPKPVLAAAGESAEPDQAFDITHFFQGDRLDTLLSTLIRNTWNFVRTSVGGFLGVFGFLLSMVIVPIYLYYLLIESRNISESWGDYVPLRASHFKDEVVATVEEINGYLIAFFRGQLLVSLINGTATGIGLVIVGLDFGLLIGLLLCFLGLIPYLGIVLCWIPAVIIAALHGNPWFMHGSPWWAFPLIVTGIFIAVQQIDGLFVTPKIVGGSVGLHPMTVIGSVFVWSLLMGGLLGAILAVPMTATIKVLLRRYVWKRRFMVAGETVFVTEESSAVERAQGSSLRDA
ncbi:MAG: hypothetical protein JWL59_2850 [Chthoniobacteraceae bacterium]|nr:hypothetical protein [Chthoniobacteraceae bacterium]